MLIFAKKNMYAYIYASIPIQGGPKIQCIILMQPFSMTRNGPPSKNESSQN